MRRNPSASHCVQNMPPEVYRPDSRVFSFGAIWTVVPTLYLHEFGRELVGKEKTRCPRAVRYGGMYLMLLCTFEDVHYRRGAICELGVHDKRSVLVDAAFSLDKFVSL